VVNQILLTSNKTKFTNLALATINGATASTLNAAIGLYDDWFEATAVPNPAVLASSASGILSSYVRTTAPLLANAPLDPSINAIPNVGGNVAAVPPTSRTGTVTIYVNPFTRSGNSCSVPTEANE
jgi:hypothetical protein